jgi:hypothetical protein
MSVCVFIRSAEIVNVANAGREIMPTAWHYLLRKSGMDHQARPKRTTIGTAFCMAHSCVYSLLSGLTVFRNKRRYLIGDAKACVFVNAICVVAM